jgi:hypothetical protein
LRLLISRPPSAGVQRVGCQTPSPREHLQRGAIAASTWMAAWRPSSTKVVPSGAELMSIVSPAAGRQPPGSFRHVSARRYVTPAPCRGGAACVAQAETGQQADGGKRSKAGRTGCGSCSGSREAIRWRVAAGVPEGPNGRAAARLGVAAIRRLTGVE